MKLDRLISDDGGTVIDRLCGSPLLAAGKVVMIGLDAVRTGMGESWAGKRERVWEFSERCFTRHAGSEAMVVRVSETDYLIVQPDLSRYAGQATCLAALKEVLTFFLGEARRGDLALREVTTLSHGSFTSRHLEDVVFADPSSADASAEVAIDPRPARAAEAPTAQSLSSPDRWSPFVSDEGRTLRISSRLEPVFEMHQARLVGHRLDPVVTCLDTQVTLDVAALRALSGADRERVDLATIARGVSRIRSTDAKARSPLIMLPAAFTTLGSSRGRAALVAALTEAKIDAWTRVVCEITDLDDVPASRLVEALSLIKPFCYAAVGRVGKNGRTLNALASAGFNGVSRLFNGERDDGALYDGLRRHVAACQGRIKVCMAFGLPSYRALAVAGAAGATHASKGFEISAPADVGPQAVAAAVA